MDTREAILNLLLKDGPLAATDLAERLSMSAAGVRRQIDPLEEEGLVETAPERIKKARGRGRPAKKFILTAKGREQFGHGYDELAVHALRALRQTGGEDAIMLFARQRIEDILQTVEEQTSTEGGLSPVEVEELAGRLAERLTEHGYAAEVQENGAGVQLCTHHCPISEVASEFPELCAAEREIVSRILGQHIQPLATIADGNGICTTNIPITPIDRRSNA